MRTTESGWMITSGAGSLSLCHDRRKVIWIKSEEFDPGSERTLAAWLRHASRTELRSNSVVAVAEG